MFMPPPAPKSSFPSLTHNPASGVRQNCRLPSATRDMINKMLDDGLPYHVILDEIGEAGEANQHPKPTNWKQGCYQTGFRQQDSSSALALRLEFAIDLLRETGDVDRARRSPDLPSWSLPPNAPIPMGPRRRTVKKLLMEKPQSYFSILNIVCRLADSGLRYEKHSISSIR